jgi:flagellar hook-associated protein 3 FlgL
MLFRVTPGHFANNTIRWAHNHNANLEHLQGQISSGLRVQKPSDDPGIISTLLANKASIERIDIELENIAISRSKLNQSVAQLITAKEGLSRANILALDGVQANPSDRMNLAREVDAILDLMLQVANSTDGGKPLYAGTSQTLVPFAVTERDDQGRITQVEYQGALERSRTVIGVQQTVDVLYTGEEVFMRQSRGETFYAGATGATTGTGTDSGVGRGELQVTHTLTSYSGTSGLVPGSETTADTVLGDYTLSIDGNAMTLRLDGGSPVTFVNGDPNVQVVAPNGAVIHVDTAGFVDGYVGDIVISGSGTLSTDGGQTTIPIDFSNNQIVQHAESGHITNVDTQNVRVAGVEHLEYLGTSNVFQALIDLRDDLINKRGLNTRDWNDSLSRSVGEIQRVHDELLEVMGEQSVALKNLDGLEARAEDYKLETQHTVASLETADIGEAIVKLQTSQNALQFTYAISMQVMQTSLLDYLR